MPDLWSCSADIGPVSLTGHAPTNPPGVFPDFAGYCFVTNDGTSGDPSDTGSDADFPYSAAFGLGIVARLFQHVTAAGVFEWITVMEFIQRPYPSSPIKEWPLILQPVPPFDPTTEWVNPSLIEPDGANGAAFFAGGTYTILKDFANGHYVFTTPLGSLTVPFFWFRNQPPPPPSPFWSPTDTPLFAIGMNNAFGYFDTTVSHDLKVPWKNFYTRQNGVIVGGAALTSADPGVWNDPPDRSEWFDHGVPQGNPAGIDLMTSLSAQRPGDYQVELIAPLDGKVYKATDEERYLENSFQEAAGLDMIEGDARNISAAVWVKPNNPTQLLVRLTRDDGATWTEQVAVSGVNPLGSPTIQQQVNGLTVLYQDMRTQTVYQTRSLDQNLTWSTPVPIPITGTNPRLVVNPETIHHYFIMRGTTIFLQRSTNVGASLTDPTPIIVAERVPMQSFDAIWTRDRRLLVAYRDSANLWVTRISQDGGLTWADA